ncbi:hypothetical protein IRJ41_003481 [Triplophysa rosa]|uniref:DUF393 domain-containing protein n=1 Tax=Triplophysa rosa TaxID=992332 RepID=A0A9W7W7M0_TRIRA|nr:hypothetical protein IRJ41_003481 [Triplophysa rosa]
MKMMSVRTAFVGSLRYIGFRASVYSSRRLLCTLQGEESSSKTVLYDGECPICVKEISFLQFLKRNRTDKVDFVDISLTEYDESRFEGVGYETAMVEMTIHRGVPAFAVMYSAVGLGWLGRLISFPIIRPLMDRAYGVFARNRLKWTGRENCTT